MRNYFILFALLITNHKSIKAQDARVSDFTAIPLITNPANTGNFDGTIRAIGYYNNMSDLTLSNNLFNLNADYKFSKNKLGLGINYMKTGSSNFNMSGNYLGLSAAKYLYLDKQKNHKVMFGMQLSYLSGEYDGLKKGYNPYIDVRAFPNTILNLPKSIDSNHFSKNQVNFNVGFGYLLKYEKFKFELDAAIYNFNTQYLRKRSITSFAVTYSLDKMNDIKFKQIYWQEGFFIPRVSSPRDSVKIKEVFFNLEWHRKEKVLSSFGLQTCGFKSISAIVGFKLNNSLSSRINYEIPFEKNQYNPSKFGLSMMYIFKGKKYKEEKVTGKDLFLNVKHDTIYVIKLDTSKIVEKNKEDGTSKNLKNTIEIKTDQKTIDSSANEEVLKSKDSLSNDLSKSDFAKETVIKNNRDTIYISKTDNVSVIKSSKEPHLDSKVQELLKINDSLLSELKKIEIQKRKDLIFDKILDTNSINNTNNNNKSITDNEQQNSYGVVYFGINEYILTPEGKNLVDKFIKNNLINIDNRILIKGYCDDLGTESWNKVLSKLRVQKVKEYLITKGFKSADISVMSFGKSKFPIAESEKSKFRKTVILFIH